MTVTIIASVARNGAIGVNGGLAFHHREDMRHFRDMTEDHAVIMGRKTWESLPVKPLPRRVNIVVSRNPNYSAPGIVVARDLAEAITLAGLFQKGEVFIIGGGQVYNEAMRMGLVDRLVLTEFDVSTPGDVFFPRFGSDVWKITEVKHRVGFRITFYKKGGTTWEP